MKTLLEMFFNKKNVERITLKGRVLIIFALLAYRLYDLLFGILAKILKIILFAFVCVLALPFCVILFAFFIFY